MKDYYSKSSTITKLLFAALPIIILLLCQPFGSFLASQQKDFTYIINRQCVVIFLKDDVFYCKLYKEGKIQNEYIQVRMDQENEYRGINIYFIN